MSDACAAGRQGARLRQRLPAASDDGAGRRPAGARPRAVRPPSGIGADGLILFTTAPSSAPRCGSERRRQPSELSGNGLRCLAALVAATQRPARRGHRDVDTDAGVEDARAAGARRRGATRSAPRWGSPTDLRQIEIAVAGETDHGVGARHGQSAVRRARAAARPERFNRARARRSRRTRRFPAGTNVEFAQVEAPDRVRILIWERGVGPTTSSGTGRHAAAAAAPRCAAAHPADQRSSGATLAALTAGEWRPAAVSGLSRRCSGRRSAYASPSQACASARAREFATSLPLGVACDGVVATAAPCRVSARYAPSQPDVRRSHCRRPRRCATRVGLGAALGRRQPARGRTRDRPRPAARRRGEGEESSWRARAAAASRSAPASAALDRAGGGPGGSRAATRRFLQRSRAADEGDPSSRPPAREAGTPRPAGLGDNELLALVLGSGSRHADALALANRCSISRWAARPTAPRPRDLPARARRRPRARGAGAGRRRTRTPHAGVATGERPRLNTPRALAAYLLPLYGARPVEQFGIVMLDTKHRMIRDHGRVGRLARHAPSCIRARCSARRPRRRPPPSSSSTTTRPAIRRRAPTTWR